MAGAVTMFCNLPHDTVTAASSITHSHRSTDTAASASEPPALPPRAPIYSKTLSSQSSRKPRSRSSDPRPSGLRVSDMRSSGSIISPRTSSSELLDDTLDVFIPLSGDEQINDDDLDLTVSVPDKIGHRKQFNSSSKSEQTISVSISTELQEHLKSDEGNGLDGVVGLEDEANDLQSPTLTSSEQMSFAKVSADSVQRVHDNEVLAESAEDRDENARDVSEDRRQQISKRPRPTVGRQLTRKETTKLSRKLTRKMSCRQQHALMMASEFDEFDELDVVVEMGNINDDDDDDDDGQSLPAIVSDSEQKNGDETLQNVDQHLDSTDDHRITTKLQYDQLQVTSCDLLLYCSMFVFIF